MAAIASAGGTTISPTTQLSVASVTCTEDIQGRDIVATRELHVDGAAVLNNSLTVSGTDVLSALSGKENSLSASSAVSVATVTASTGMTITGGRGGVSTNGAQLRLVSTDSSTSIAPPAVYWG